VPIELIRIDDRLLHGQVLVGWGERLGIGFYVVVDDPLAASPWEQELYAAGMPEGVPVEFLDVAEASRRFDELDARKARGAILTRDTSTMRALAEAGVLRDRRVNVGGVHIQEGRRKVLDYVYLGGSEIEDLRAIDDCTGAVTARDLPTSKEVGLDSLLHAAHRT
jgi:PTS system mannose-specific IIB component/fructoselysine and glucoselysine-specific PTS system IIB component